jgi:hypothetical protein
MSSENIEAFFPPLHSTPFYGRKGHNDEIVNEEDERRKKRREKKSSRIYLQCKFMHIHNEKTFQFSHNSQLEFYQFSKHRE